MTSVRFLTSVATSRGEAKRHQMANSLRYSSSVIFGQCFSGLVQSQPSPPVIKKSMSFHPPGPGTQTNTHRRKWKYTHNMHNCKLYMCSLHSLHTSKDVNQNHIHWVNGWFLAFVRHCDLEAHYESRSPCLICTWFQTGQDLPSSFSSF